MDIAACAIPGYPDAARRVAIQGKTIIKLIINNTGKIRDFQLERSSGWKLLDPTVMKAIVGCQIISKARWITSELRSPISGHLSKLMSATRCLPLKVANPLISFASPSIEKMKSVSSPACPFLTEKEYSRPKSSRGR